MHVCWMNSFSNVVWSSLCGLTSHMIECVSLPRCGGFIFISTTRVTQRTHVLTCTCWHTHTLLLPWSSERLYHINIVSLKGFPRTKGWFLQAVGVREDLVGLGYFWSKMKSQKPPESNTLARSIIPKSFSWILSEYAVYKMNPNLPFYLIDFLLFLFIHLWYIHI